MEIDDRDLLVERDAVSLGVGDVAADQSLDRPDRAVETADERVDRPATDDGPCPLVASCTFDDDHLDELAEGAHLGAFDGDASLADGRRLGFS